MCVPGELGLMGAHPSPDETRRPGVACHTLTLADGTDWGFATPSLRLRPVVRAGPGGPEPALGTEACVGYPLEIERLVGSVESELEGDSAEALVDSFLSLASALLRRCHDVNASQAAALLDVDEEAFAGLARRVFAVLRGGPPRAGENITVPHDD
jgi:hypothetical protein